MAKTKKPQKSLLSEGAVRRFMKLADIPELSDGFLSEANPFGGEKDDRKKGGADKDASQESEDTADYEKPTSKKGKERREKAGLKAESLFAEEDDDESMGDPSETHPGELDYEGGEVEDVEAVEAEGNGEMPEMTPEQAEAVVALANSIESSGALEGGAVEGEAEMDVDMGGGEDMAPVGDVGLEDEDDVEELEEQLKTLGIEVIDDSPGKLKEAVYRRVVKRLLNEKKKVAQSKKVDRMVNRIFTRIQKQS